MLNFLRNTIILSLLFVAIDANGKFAVLNAPNSLDFQGNDPVRGEEVGNIVSAAVGGTVDDGSWSGFTVVDPFNMPSHPVVALIDGYNIDMTTAKYEYPVEGNGVLDSLNNVLEDMKAAKVTTCHVDYNSKKAKSANKCFGISAVSDAKTLPKTSSLNANNDVDNNFLQAVADLSGAVDNFSKQQGTKDVEMKEIVFMRLSLTPLVNAYGADSAEVAEAANLVKQALVKLQKVSGDALFIVVSGTEELAKSRSKRAEVPPSTTNEYNLAKYYDSDYPVIFNIILWFMVVFGLSLLAISYAIGSMDPGRDSIIYRMTSTRMKKDN